MSKFPVEISDDEIDSYCHEWEIAGLEVYRYRATAYQVNPHKGRVESRIAVSAKRDDREWIVQDYVYCGGKWRGSINLGDYP